MKKRSIDDKKIIIVFIIMIVSILVPKLVTQADESNIKSRGNIKGIINFYTEDIEYLETEIQSLIEECREEVYE